MRRINLVGFVLFVSLFLVSVTPKLVLARLCDSSDNYCEGWYAVKCKADGSGYTSSYCYAGCTGAGRCRCTSATTYTSYGSCVNGIQTRSIKVANPSGCVSSSLSRSCCTTTSYPTTCNSSTGKISYCYNSQPVTADCAYGACKDSSTCASCNSTSGCMSGYKCVNGSCVSSTYWYYDGGCKSTTSYSSLSACYSGTGHACFSSQASCVSAYSCTALGGTCRGTCGSYESPNNDGRNQCYPATCCVLNPGTAKENGVCGSQDDTLTRPSDSAACSRGTVYWTDVSAYSGYYKWYCEGVAGGADSGACSAKRIFTSGCGKTVDGIVTTIPLGTVKCGDGSDSLPNTNQLYTCTSSGWVVKGSSCREQVGTACLAELLGAVVAGCGCKNPAVYADSGCDDDSKCTGQGGSCSLPLSTAEGASCTTNGGIQGVATSNLCLSDESFNKYKCCAPISYSTSCESIWPGSSCMALDSCPSGLQMGTITSCIGGMVCCGDVNTKIICDDSGYLNCGDCETCINPGTINSYCKSTKTAGDCGSTFKCNVGTATNKETVAAADGSTTYTWDCAGSCVTTRSCSKSCTTVTNGVCGETAGSCITGTASGVGTTKITATGIDDVWSCFGDCGGTDDDTCTSNKCTNDPDYDFFDGACNDSVKGTSDSDLCAKGTPKYVDAQDANHDYLIDTASESMYVWICQGNPAGDCNEPAGKDSSICSSAIDQQSWFQVNDGNVLAKGKVNNYVPQTTCDGQGKGCASMVSVSAGGNQNGFVYGKSISIGHDGQSERAESLSLNFKTYAYNDLKNSYLAKNGVGTTFADNPSWDEFKDVQGVVFVNGNLEIKDNLDKTGFLMIIAKDTITIDSNVNLVNAVLVANNVVAAAADEDSTEEVGSLIINGMVHGVNSVKFSRSLVPKSNNNDSPSVLVNYKPELLFMIPTELSKAFSSWKVN